MFKVKTIAASAAAMILAASAANAASITLQDSFSAFGVVASEDFESFAAPAEYLSGVMSADVGMFTSLGGTGTGESVIGTGGGLAVDNSTLFGRSNTTPAGSQWLASNDTDGIQWDVMSGSAFNQISFSLSDPTDTGAQLTIAAGGVTSTAVLPAFSEANGSVQWVVIMLDSLVTSATVTLTNDSENDGFGIDDATLAAVPLPAGALLMLTGLGGLAAARRRKAAK